MKSFAFFLIVLLMTAATATSGPIPGITGEVRTDFGVYRPVAATVTPAVSRYEVKPDLSNVAGTDFYQFDEKTLALLAANGFAARGSWFRQPYDIYNQNEDKGYPAFVTTDACLHTYHILYDYMLRILEVKYFIADLENLTGALIRSQVQAYETAQDAKVKDAALRNVAYLSVALSLLDSTATMDSRVLVTVKAELAKIYAPAGGYENSPLFFAPDYPFQEDYSQYRPRGHYTRSPELGRYFRAMMWYGRITFSLNLPYAAPEGLRRAARQALLLSRALSAEKAGSETASAVWERIYQPTIFFVGKADDITWQAYNEKAREQFGNDFLTRSQDILADDAALDGFIQKALTLPDPRITVAAGKGFRLMGQRFIPDSYILDQLVFQNVYNRMMPRGLDVMAALGSARAYEILDTVYQDTKYPNYPQQMEKLRKEFREYPAADWAQNLYWNWLYTLLPLLDPKGEGWPVFMRNRAWTDKGLNTALGSWAELRHDTILYAKQSETDKSLPLVPPVVPGYVEPEPEVYARLAALADFMERGLAGRGLLDPLIGERLAKFESLMLALKDIAVKELQNITPSNAEYALLVNFGGSIEEIVSFPADTPNLPKGEADDYMAIIADVHTDPNSNTALEVGVGHPLEILVIAPVNGVPTITRGAIFSYHEFIQPLASGRLTDEEWQALQSSPKAVSMPEWTESFVAGVEPVTVRHFVANPYKATGIADEKPSSFRLFQNIPNPFNPATVIRFAIPSDSATRLAVYTLTGQRIAVLHEGPLARGEHQFTWAPEGLASGVYLVRLEWNGHAETIRAVFVK